MLNAWWIHYRKDALAISILFILPLLLFASVTIGHHTLIPLDNLVQWAPWNAYADQLGVSVPHNELLSDLLLENFVWKDFILRSLEQPGGLTNRLPLWNPHIFAGMPFLADGQHSALYPFSLLFYILPPLKAYGWFTVLQLWLAGTFTYLFCRTLGANRTGSLLGGITFSMSALFVNRVVFTMIIAAMAWLPLILTCIEQVIRHQAQGGTGKTLLYTILGAIAIGCQLLAGHPEFTYYTALIASAYALWRLLREIPRLGFPQTLRTTGWLALTASLGLGLGAAQFFPLFELVRHNFRAGSATYEQIISWAYPWRRIIAFFIPNFFGNPTHHTYFDIFTRQVRPVTQNLYGEPIDRIYWGIKNAVEGGCYLGLLPMPLALIALLGRKGHPGNAPETYTRSRPTIYFFTALALISLAFIFGTPLYRLLYLLPGIDQLHSPFRWVFAYTLSLAVLAAFGATYLSGTDRQTTSAYSSFTGANTQRLIGWPLFWSGISLLTALFLAIPLADHILPLCDRAIRALALADQAFANAQVFFSYEWLNLTLFALLLIGTGAILRITRCPIYLPPRLGSYGVWKPLAILLLSVDLLLAGYRFNPSADPQILTFTPPAIQFLQQKQAEEPPFRITTYNAPGEATFNANLPMLYGLHDARGYDSIILKNYVNYMHLVSPQNQLEYNRIAPLWTTHPEALDSPLLDLLNVRYIVTTQTIENPRYTLVFDDGVRIYRNEGALPRAFVLPAESTAYVDDLSEAVKHLDPRHYLLLSSDQPAPPWPVGTPQPHSPLPATITAYLYNEVWIDVDMPTDGWLILSDTYFLGWRAYLRPRGGDESSEREIPIYTAYGVFRAVPLPAGEYTVRFKYTPNSVKVGLFLSFLAGMILLLLFGIWLWRRIYRPTQTSTDARRVAKNSIAPIILQLFNKTITIAFQMLALRILQAENAGKYFFVVTVTMWFNAFIEFGLNTLLQREIARNKHAANRYLSNSTILRLILSAIAIPLMFLFIGGWQLLDQEPLGSDRVWALILLLIGLIPSNIAGGISALFNAFEDMEYPAAITTVTTLLTVTLGTGALLLGWGIVGLAAVSIVVNAITLAILATLASRRYFKPHREWDPLLVRTMVRESWPLMINNVLSLQFFKIDVTIMDWLAGSRMVGLYTAVSYRILDAINIVPASFTIALFPLMSRYAASARESLQRAYHLAIQLLVLVALPLAMTFTLLAYPIATLIGGSGYMPDAAIALQWMIWSIPVGFINSVTHYVLIALGRQRQLTVTFLIGLGFTIAANVFAIPRWGYRASALIHTFSELVLLTAFYVLLRRDLPPVPWIRLLWRPALAGLSMALTAWGLSPLPNALALLAALLVYGAILALTGVLRDPQMAVLADLLPKRLKRDTAPLAEVQ